MSSVLISGVEFSKTAFSCSTKINPDERKCNFTGKIFTETLSLLCEKKCDDCPIKFTELPMAHGRLIDAEELLMVIGNADTFEPSINDNIMRTSEIVRKIEEAPTIIGAESDYCEN